MAKSKYRYDVFISHAVEDKIPVANDLYDALVARGLKVWYSGKELSIGARLIETIFQGVDECRYGVVILSPTYITKIWPLGEFFTFLQRGQQENENSILPVLYDITPEELGKRYPLMANIVAVRASNGVDHVATEICKAVGKCKEPSSLPPRRPPVPWRKITLVACVCLLLSLAVYGVMPFFSRHPGTAIITETIEHHIRDLQRESDQRLQTLIRQQQMNPVMLSRAVNVYDSFWRTSSYYRNEYTLVHAGKEVSGRRNVEMTLRRPTKEFTPANQYGMTNPQVYASASSYVFYNPQSVTYTTTIAREEGDGYEVTVTYSEGVRMVYTKLVFPKSVSDTKRHQVTITALPPTETYTFVQAGDEWVLQGVK